jgi:short-subunit dehydrogenase
MATALITGGTVGMGHAFATRLARDGWDLVLASRDEAGLNNVAAEFRADYGVAVEVIPTDLAVRAEVLALAARLEDPERPVDLLVNNAGMGCHDSLVDLDVDAAVRLVDVMGLAPVILGAAAARAMRARGRGGIVTTASAASVLKTDLYGAVKAMVANWSVALSIELRGTGVRALTLLPGWVETELHRRAGIKANSFPAAVKAVVYVPVRTVVDQALDALAKDQVVCVPTRRWTVATWLARVVPQRANWWASDGLTRLRHGASD